MAKEVSVDKFPVNLDHCGNTSAANIPILIDEMNQGRAGFLRVKRWYCPGFGARPDMGEQVLLTDGRPPP